MWKYHHMSSKKFLLFIPYRNKKYKWERKLCIHGICSTSSRHDGSGISDESVVIKQADTKRRHLLFLSPTLWPQPNASAAGVRTAALLQHFASPNQNLFEQIHYGCGLEKDHSTITIPGVQMHHLPPNRSEQFLQFLHRDGLDGTLRAVVFDRFFAEEAYSFYFQGRGRGGDGKMSDVLRVLDMQDMHSLRYHRQNLVETMDNMDRFGGGLDHLSSGSGSRIVDGFPMVDIFDRGKEKSSKNSSMTLLRELAAIHRSDLTLVCSSFELDLLIDEYGIPRDKLVLAPFFTNNDEECQAPSHSFETRRDFVSLGGFKHPPNVDQVICLKKHIWPQIKKKIPDAKLHIYGSYSPPRIQQLHDAKSGFLVHGYVDDLALPLRRCRVMLAPLRYGAGVKGKVVDAWRYGCPVVTTSIGAEGIGLVHQQQQEECDEMPNDMNWGGSVASDNQSFIQSAINLYSDKTQWMKSQSSARLLLKTLFDAETNLKVVDDAIANAVDDVHSRRRRDYTSGMLWHHSTRSTEYFSRWIELKESLRKEE